MGNNKAKGLEGTTAMNFKELETTQKLRGGYYTPLPIAQFMCRWALSGGAKTVLEPSCGDGVFLKAIGTMLCEDASAPVLTVDAIELLKEEAEKSNDVAKELCQFGANASVYNMDFFEWLNTKKASETWDAILGNPPYIRYQYFDHQLRKESEAIFSRANVPFTKRTNAWVPFVIGSVMHLSPGGRIALVLPAETSYIQHAEGLRKLIEQEMETIRIIYLREIVFEGTLQGIILFLGVKRTDRPFQPIARASVNELPFFEEGDQHCADMQIIDIGGIDELQEMSLDSLDQHNKQKIHFNGQWMYPLLHRDELTLMKKVSELPSVTEFSSIASVDIGIVTGANNYFCVDSETVERFGLHDITLPMLARSELIKGIIYTENDHNGNARDGRDVFFLHFPAKPVQQLPKGYIDYIRIGEQEKLHTRYKCRIRDPWYVVPYVWKSEVGLLKRCHMFPRLVYNEYGAYSTDTAYRIRMDAQYVGREKDFVFSFLNSLTLLHAELGGRHYGGGVLELIPSEIEPLPVPLVNVSDFDFFCVDSMIRSGEEIDRILDYTDALILGEGIGLTVSEIRKIKECYKRIRSRRLRIEAKDEGAVSLC